MELISVFFYQLKQRRTFAVLCVTYLDALELRHQTISYSKV